MKPSDYYFGFVYLNKESNPMSDQFFISVAEKSRWDESHLFSRQIPDNILQQIKLAGLEFIESEESMFEVCEVDDSMWRKTLDDENNTGKANLISKKKVMGLLVEVGFTYNREIDSHV